MRILGTDHLPPTWRKFPWLSQQLMAYVLVGLVSGVGTCLFSWLLNGVTAIALGAACNYYPPEPAGEPSMVTHATAFLNAFGGPPRAWLLILMPAIGAVFSSALVNIFAPEAEGHGTDSAILAYHHLGGRIRARVPLIKALSSAFTIGTGGSAGPEGPIAQIGAGFGSVMATLLNLPVGQRRLLMMAGVGAGVGAIFKAPLAGAIFAAEVLYLREEIEHEALLPATVAAVVSYSVFSSVFGHQPILSAPDAGFSRPLELLGYAFLGVVCAAGGWLFVRCFYGLRDFLHRFHRTKSWHPIMGGLATGLIGFFVPSVLGTSEGSIQLALNGQLNFKGLVALAFGKIAATSTSIASGGSGGLLGPSLVIGAALGGATGLAFQRLGLVSNPHGMIICGMAAFFAGAANTPLSTIIMVSEMTSNYQLLAPAMLCCTVSAALMRRHSLYETQESSRARSGAHAHDLSSDLLGSLHIADCMEQQPQTLSADTGHEELLRRLADGGHTRYPVLNAAGEVMGVVDTRGVLSRIARHPDRPVDLADVIDPKYTAAEPQLSLLEAAALLDVDPHGLLLVVDPSAPRHLVGVLRRQDIVRAYHLASTATPEPPSNAAQEG